VLLSGALPWGVTDLVQTQRWIVSSRGNGVKGVEASLAGPAASL